MQRLALPVCLFALLSAATGCSANSAKGSDTHSNPGAGGSSSNLNLGGSGAGATLNLGDGGPMDVDAGDGSNVQTCDQAAAIGSYVGCDFWPTTIPSVVGLGIVSVTVFCSPGKSGPIHWRASAT